MHGTKYQIPAIFSTYLNGDSSFVITKLHKRWTVQLPIARASSLGQIKQKNIKELHELLFHVFRVCYTAQLNVACLSGVRYERIV